jgi:hypothetical protein
MLDSLRFTESFFTVDNKQSAGKSFSSIAEAFSQDIPQIGF